MQHNQKLNRETMDFLQRLLLQHNHCTKLFLHMYEVLQNSLSRELGIQILAERSTDVQCYNMLAVDEIAVVIPGDKSHAADPWDIVLHTCNGKLRFIHDHYYAYIPLYYILLFPFGTPGWMYKMRQTVSDSTQVTRAKMVSQVSLRWV